MDPDGGASPGSFLSRSEVLGGLGARRAATLFFAIQNRTSQVVARARFALAGFDTELTAADHERAWLDALSAGRETPRPPRIQDLERYASDWAALVPEDPPTRAALARVLANAYRFRRPDIPRIHRALGLDDPAVATAFTSATGTALESIYAPSLPLADRLRWWRARLAERIETLPPFWIAAALLLTKTVGAGILALPIALAALGLGGAVGVVVGIGLVNLLTVLALVETITRNGNIRFGSGFFGRLIGDYLGRPGSVLLQLVILPYALISLLVQFLGFGSALEGVTGVTALAWVGVLLVTNLAFLRRGSIDSTVASALVIGAVNLLLLLALAAVSLISTPPTASAPAPISMPVSLDPALIGVVFGVTMASFFGHTAVANGAKVVLRRDPSGRALLYGSVTAMAVAILLQLLIVIAVFSAVGPASLIGYPGTILTPLSAAAGPLVGVLASLYAVLALGLSSVHSSLTLFNLVGERLPRTAFAGFWIRVMPVLAVFVVLSAMLILGIGSFAGALNIIGALTLPLLAGIFPLLLLTSSRRQADFDVDHSVGWIGHPAVVAVLLGLFVGVVAAHVLWIWNDPLYLVAGTLSVAIMLAISGWALWGGALRSRVVVELRVDSDRDDGPARLAFLSRGSPRPMYVAIESGAAKAPFHGAMAVLGNLSGIRSLETTIPADTAADLKVWLHRITPDGDSVPLPVTAEIDGDGVELERDGQAIIPLDGRETRLLIRGPQTHPGPSSPARRR